MATSAAVSPPLMTACAVPSARPHPPLCSGETPRSPASICRVL
ncbi:hypothetical protein FHS40_009037 [Streptomyces spectabilis]|uniref:Uncharacterized protein n=1 Tax=Streptomyces spectabilis TaxID=68270 RepID=A0A7W8B4T2_STRST|nr:hypothetical protein [Streptomyces spectabilis]